MRSIKWLRQLKLGLVALLSCTAVSGQQRAEADANRYDPFVAKAAEQGASGVLIIVENGRTVSARGFGDADREHHQPYGVETVHDIGSITKPFTGAAVVDLALQGKIDLKAPVRQYLPDAAEPVASVTVEQLLTHRSGMPEYCGDETADATKRAMLQHCMAAPLRFPAGSNWGYSNPGFSVLGMIVEVVSRVSLDEYLKVRFFRPLHMDHTGYEVPKDQPVAVGYDGAKRHVAFNGSQVVNGHHWNVAGNGGMQSTAADMRRWFDALSRPGGGLPEPLRQALTAPHAPRSKQLADGYDWAFLLDPTGKLISMSHAGSDGVFYSYFYWNMATGVFFYLNTNSGEDVGLQLSRSIRRAAAAPRATDL